MCLQMRNFNGVNIDYREIPAILKLGSFDQPIPRGLRQLSESLQYAYKIFEHPLMLWDTVAKGIDPFEAAMENPEEFKKFNRTIIERTIAQAQGFADLKVADYTLTMNGQSIEMALTTFRDDWAIMNEINEIIKKPEAELRDDAVNIHFLRLHLSGQLTAVLKTLLSTTESLIVEVLKGYTIAQSKKQENSSDAYQFLIRWRADLQNKKDQFSSHAFEAIIQVVENELEVAERMENQHGLGELKALVESFLKERDAAKSNDKLLRSLVKGDYSAFQDDLKELVLHLFSYHDIGNNEPEKVYHSFLLGVMNSFHAFYDPISNQEAGHGRFDIVLIPHDKDMTGLIFEVKRSTSIVGTEMKTLAENALKQVHEKDYAIKFRSKGVVNWATFAVVFYGKNLHTEFELTANEQ
jgi:hypothetical protein